MSFEQNKAVIQRLFETLNLRNTDLLYKFTDENYAENYVGHYTDYAGLERGPEGMKEWYRQHPGGNNSYEHFVIEDMFGEGEKVATRFIFRYTDNTGKSGALWCLNIMHFSGGKISEEWQLGESIPE